MLSVNIHAGLNIYLLTTCIFKFRQVCTIGPSFFKITSGMYRRPFQGRNLVFQIVIKVTLFHTYNSKIRLNFQRYDHLHISEPLLNPMSTKVFRKTWKHFLQSIVPRLGRVCKDDPGTIHRRSSKWTTFLKASLDCANPGEAPFFFDSLESVAYLSSEEMFYGLFSTQRWLRSFISA